MREVASQFNYLVRSVQQKMFGEPRWCRDGRARKARKAVGDEPKKSDKIQWLARKRSIEWQGGARDMTAPLFTIREVLFYERPVRLRMPFRFGVVTLTQAPQCFVRVRSKGRDGQSHWGASAELLAPKWFDKNLALSNDENFDQLRFSLMLAADAYLAPGPARTAFRSTASP